MNILLVGGPSQLMDTMVDTVNKNGHKSYVLMEGGKDSSAYRRAFEKYSFSYQDESIKDVMQGINPDAVLFMGAQDTSFAWEEKGSRELSRYTASIANIISVYASSANGRFIYLSSDEIYGSSGNACPGGLGAPGARSAGAAPAAWGRTRRLRRTVTGRWPLCRGRESAKTAGKPRERTLWY